MHKIHLKNIKQVLIYNIHSYPIVLDYHLYIMAPFIASIFKKNAFRIVFRIKKLKFLLHNCYLSSISSAKIGNCPF